MYRKIIFRVATRYVFTNDKRSLGQGNVFTGVCHSFCPQGEGGWLPIMHHRSHPGCLPAGGLNLGGLPPVAREGVCIEEGDLHTGVPS